MLMSEEGKAAKKTIDLINNFVNEICEVLGEQDNKIRIRQGVVNAVFANMEQMPDDLERKARLEKHVKTLQDFYHIIAEGENWEMMQELSGAMVAGGMAIQRVLREDYPKENKDGKIH